MKNFFLPKTIAIIGASASKEKLGYQLMKNLLDAGFKGKVYPINLKEKKILGLRAYTSVLKTRSKIDLAVIIVPRKVVPPVLKECVTKKIPFAVIISAGFAEKDKTGAVLQEKIEKIVKKSKTKIIGPNCFGLINTDKNINLTFAASSVQQGRISLVLQSGAIGAAIFDWAKENNIGINKFISLGNKLNISEIDALEILEKDTQTKAIVLYLEELTNPGKFLAICRKISPKKPIIILKGGMSKKGAQAASSHTAALSTPEELNLALFAQAGLIIARDYEEVLNFMRLLAYSDINMKNNNLAIVTNAGGPGILAADSASESGLDLPRPDQDEQNHLKSILENFASLNNPFDLGGDALAEDYQQAITYLEKKADFGIILAIITPQSNTEIEKTAEVLTGFAKNPKPVIASFLGGQKIKPALKKLTKEHLPYFEDPSEAIETVSKIYHYKEHIKKDLWPLGIIKKPAQKEITENSLISEYRLPVAPQVVVKNHEQLYDALEKIKFPLVYKSATALHRGKEGKVQLNISDQAGLGRAVKKIGYPGIVQKMIDSPFEVFIGAKKDPSFGLALLFGGGGIFVEEEKDIKMKIWPLTKADLDEMIEEASIWPEIKGYRVKSDLHDTVLKIAQLMISNPQINYLELNPVKILLDKIIAVDINFKTKND